MAETAETHQPSTPNPPTEASGSGSTQAPNVSGSQSVANGSQQTSPMSHPILVPGSIPMPNPVENDNGAGLYAVPYYPFMGTMTGTSPSTLIPLRFNIPTESSSTGVGGEDQRQEAGQPHGAQRQVVVRRFQFAIHLDLSLILKLAAAIFLFNQDGSRQRLLILVFFAALIYLYQTGALSPLLRWIKRGAAPPQRPPVPPQNAPLIADGNEPQNVDNAGGDDQNQNLNQPAGAGLPAVNEEQPEPERRNGVDWVGIVREIQTIVVGFISSLLPGFHHND